MRNLALMLAMCAVTVAVRPALAAEITLTTVESQDGKSLLKRPVNYDQLVDALVEGDVVVFSDGTKIALGKFLGQGNTNRVFAISEDKVIRIPRVNDDIKISYTTSSIPRITLKGYEPIQKYSVHAVRVYPELSRESEYVIAERVQPKFDLAWYNENRSKFDSAAKKKLDQELIEFARSTSDFIRIGDFATGQVAYTEERGWMLLDWTDLHMLRADHPEYNRTIFDRVYLPDQRDLVMTPEIPMPFLLKFKAKRAIKQERRVPRCEAIFGGAN
jgi:hypothetical protein